MRSIAIARSQEADRPTSATRRRVSAAVKPHELVPEIR